MANLFTRPDTFLGVCEAIGQDLGVHPNALRIALGVAVLWQPVWAIAGYLVAALLILALRLLVPDAKETIAEAPAIDQADDEAGMLKAA